MRKEPEMTDDMKTVKNTENDDTPSPTRRQMLVRLGLMTGAIYAAPTLASLSEAKASSFSSSDDRRRRRRRRRRHRYGGHLNTAG
jgi:hypothetical protein